MIRPVPVQAASTGVNKPLPQSSAGAQIGLPQTQHHDRRTPGQAFFFCPKTDDAG